jgi:hypothetical protein
MTDVDALANYLAHGSGRFIMAGLVLGISAGIIALNLAARWAQRIFH